MMLALINLRHYKLGDGSVPAKRLRFCAVYPQNEHSQFTNWYECKAKGDKKN